MRGTCSEEMYEDCDFPTFTFEIVMCSHVIKVAVKQAVLCDRKHLTFLMFFAVKMSAIIAIDKILMKNMKIRPCFGSH